MTHEKHIILLDIKITARLVRILFGIPTDWAAAVIEILAFLLKKR